MRKLVRRLGMAAGILIVVLVLAVVGLYSIMPKAPKPKGELQSVSEMEAYFESVVAANHPPGLSVAVVKDGRMVYANGFGIADGPQGVPVTKDTVYHWWSMTKIPTAVAVMQLHERGLLDIDDPVSDYLPYYEVTYDGAQETVTIRQLLNHTAGMSNAAPELFTWLHLEGDPPVNQTELLREKLPDYTELLFSPGEKVQYSNFGYMVLGAIIEAVSGQTYENFMADNILAPLGMEHTNFVYTEAMAELEATGSQHFVDMYTLFFPLLRLNFIIRERTGLRAWLVRVYNDQTPPTGLIGSAADVGRFMGAYLQNDGTLLQPETMAMMNEVLAELTAPGDSARGLGWEANLTAEGRRYLTHSGGGPGFATIFRVYPEENLGVVVMGNDSTIDRGVLADVLANMDW